MFILFHLFVQNHREQFFSEIRQLRVQISRYQKGKTNLMSILLDQSFQFPIDKPIHR